MTHGGNLWESSAKETFQAAVLTDNIDVDLVTIGGGYTGLSAALEAVKQGARVAVLEAQTIGFGGSGRNVGLVNAGLWLPPEKVIEILGEGAGQRLNQVLAAAPDAVFDLIDLYSIDCEPVRNGTLHCAHSKRGFGQLQDRYRQQMNAGAPVSLLSETVAKARTGSAAVFGALHDARAGTIHPLSYARGLARAATSSGAQVYERSQAISIAQEGGAWRVTTAQGDVTARHLLVATNAYHKPVENLAIAPVTMVSFFQLATNPLDSDLVQTILPRGEGCWDTGTVMTSFRTDDANRFIIGGMGQLDDFGVNRNWARRAMVRHYPQLATTRLNYSWSGQIAMPDDHLPKVLRLGQASDLSGYAVLGYSGRGIGPGTIMGRAVARALLGVDEDQIPLVPVDQFGVGFVRGKTIFYETAARVGHFLLLR